MRVAALVCRDRAVITRLERALADAVRLVPVDSLSRGVEQSASLLSDFVLVDVGSARVEPEDLAAVRTSHPHAFLVGLIGQDEAGIPVTEGYDLVIPIDLPDSVLRSAIDRAVHFQRLGREVASLRRERARHDATPPPTAQTAGNGSGDLWTVLREMGKLLAAHFDLERVVEFFLDAITELVRPGRVALLLEDEDGRYRVRGQRGLDPALTAHVRLDPVEGLPAWFLRSARLAVRAELERDPEWIDAARELLMMGGDVAVPLWVQARVVGILVLGSRVTGHPYTSEDLERLFTLASQVAVAVQDIALFNTVRAQHGFIEQVLGELQTGAITIAASGRVTLVNRRAEEILGIRKDEVVGQDLRALPSPLGDLLYDTVRGGRELRREEVTIPRPPSTTLEVSTSRILSAGGGTAGAVAILEDPEPRLRLLRERQQTQSLDLLNRVLLRLTDEIKNPLVSIYTFLELLPHRYDDTEFRDKFFAVVSRDTQNLISLVDKLIILAGEREYKVDFCDLRDLVNDALEDVTLRFERPRMAQDAAIFLLQPADRPERVTAVLYTPDTDLVVKGDRDQLAKAIGYLVRFLLNRVAGDGRVVIHVTSTQDGRSVRLSILGKPAALTPGERDRLFSPLAIASERLLDVGPSVSQKIVEAHGGSLTVGGEEGEIRFVLTLPRTAT